MMEVMADLHLKSVIFCRILVGTLTRFRKCPLISRCHRIFNMNFKNHLTCYCSIKILHLILHLSCTELSYSCSLVPNEWMLIIRSCKAPLVFMNYFFFLCCIICAYSQLDIHYILNNLCYSILSAYICVYVYILNKFYVLNLHSHPIQFLIYFTNIFEISLHCCLKM